MIEGFNVCDIKIRICQNSWAFIGKRPLLDRIDWFLFI